MARSGRPRDRFSADEPVYPPPIGEMPRGRPRARTLDDSGFDAPPPYPSPEPRGSFPSQPLPFRQRQQGRHGGIGREPRRSPESPERRRLDPYRAHPPEPRRDDSSYYSQEADFDPRHPSRAPAYQLPPSPPLGASSGHRRHRRRRQRDAYSSPEPDFDYCRQQPSGGPAYPGPPFPPAPSGHRRRDEYLSPDPPPPRRAKSAAVRKGSRTDVSPARLGRYESPDPTARRRRSPGMRHQPARDIRYDRPYGEYGEPRDGRRWDADPRRDYDSRAPPYAHNEYRSRVRPMSPLDRDRDRGSNGRGRPSERRYQSSSPQPRRQARPRSMPAKSKGGRLPASMQNIAWQTVARTALTAGAQAAFKARNDPTPWVGEKGARVATAALGAAIVDGFMGGKGQADKGSGSGGGKKTKGFQKAAGFAADRFAERSRAKKR